MNSANYRRNWKDAWKKGETKKREGRHKRREWRELNGHKRRKTKWIRRATEAAECEGKKSGRIKEAFCGK